MTTFCVGMSGSVLWLLRELAHLLGEGNGTPLQYSCLENPMDWGAWKAAAHGVAESRTGLSDFTFYFHALEKEMATHSSVLAWRIPGMAEPGGLPSMGSHRVRHDWSNLAAAALSFRPIKLELQAKTKKGSKRYFKSQTENYKISVSLSVWIYVCVCVCLCLVFFW